MRCDADNGQGKEVTFQRTGKKDSSEISALLPVVQLVRSDAFRITSRNRSLVQSHALQEMKQRFRDMVFQRVIQVGLHHDGDGYSAVHGPDS